MAQIDTSVYGRMRTPAQELLGLSKSLGNYANTYRQGAMNDVRLQQQQIGLQDAQRKQAKAEDFKRRQDQYQQALSLDPMMSPETRQDLESRMFQPEMLEQRLRSGLRGGDPFAERKMELAEAEAKQKSERLRLAKERLGLAKETNEQKKVRLQETIDRQDWRESVKITDDIARDVAQEETIANRKWTNEFKLNKGPREYKQVQTELLGQVPSMLRGNYRGTSASSAKGKDLTPENIKVLTTATVGTSKILESTDQLVNMVEKHGKKYMPTEEKAEMESLIADIALAYKGDDFARLGVLNGDDLKILLKIMGDPTTLIGAPANQQLKKLTTFRNILLRGYNKKLDTRGFNPLSPEQIRSVGGASAPAISNENKSISDSIAEELGIK